MGKDTDIIYEENFTCPQLWQRLVIGSDGEVLLCANDEMGAYKIGNAKNESLHSIWHGEKMTTARKWHMKHMGVDKVSPCKYCYLPRKTKRDTAAVDGRLINIDNYINRDQTVGK